MANLYNDRKSLLVRLRLVDRERARRAGAADGPPQHGRVLAQAGVEHFDRKDGAWWPLLRVPALWLEPPAPGSLLEELERLVRGESTGFAWRASSDAIALQLGRHEDGRLLVELGADLSGFLIEQTGAGAPTGESLALFRLVSTQAALVAFAGELRDELRELD